MAKKDLLTLAPEGTEYKSTSGIFFKKGGKWLHKFYPKISGDVFIGDLKSDSDFFSLTKLAFSEGQRNSEKGVFFTYNDRLLNLEYTGDTRYGSRFVLYARDLKNFKDKEYPLFDKYDNLQSFSKWVKSNCDYREPEIQDAGIEKINKKTLKDMITDEDLSPSAVTDKKELDFLEKQLENDKDLIAKIESQPATKETQAKEPQAKENTKTTGKATTTKATRQVKAQAKKLKPIEKNIGIEREFNKALREFSKEVLKSVNYWSIAQINKYKRGDITNISRVLSVEFSDLLRVWNKKSEVFAKKLSNAINDRIKNHVDLGFKNQGKEYILETLSRKSAQVLNANILQNIALIKSIPRDIIEKYQVLLYNNITDFDLQATQKTITTFASTTLKRAKIIARDQTAKAIENYAMSRSQDLGFEYYIWQTAKDERVSKGKGGHDKLEGRIYRYDTPTAVIDSYGNKGHCSQRVNCRCLSSPLFLEPNQTLKLVRDSDAGDYYVLVEK
jgi:hypothetical protein